MKIKKYLAFFDEELEFEFFDTIEEAKEWLNSWMLDEGYMTPTPENCGIYKLHIGVEKEVVEGGKDSTWNPEFGEIWKHDFVKVAD